MAQTDEEVLILHAVKDFVAGRVSFRQGDRLALVLGLDGRAMVVHDVTVEMSGIVDAMKAGLFICCDRPVSSAVSRLAPVADVQNRQRLAKPFVSPRRSKTTA